MFGTNFTIDIELYNKSILRTQTLIEQRLENLSVFSYHMLSVVRLSVRLSVNFTFSIFTSKLLGQFQPIFAQNTHRQRGLNVVKIKDHTLLKGEMIGNYRKILKYFQNSFFQDPIGRQADTSLEAF